MKNAWQPLSHILIPLHSPKFAFSYPAKVPNMSGGGAVGAGGTAFSSSSTSWSGMSDPVYWVGKFCAWPTHENININT